MRQWRNSLYFWKIRKLRILCIFEKAGKLGTVMLGTLDDADITHVLGFQSKSQLSPSLLIKIYGSFC